MDKKIDIKNCPKKFGNFFRKSKKEANVPKPPQNYARDLRENFWQLGLLSLLGMDLKDMKTIWENLGEAEQVTSQ